MRTTVFTLSILTLALTLSACGAGGGDPYIGYEDGQHFGDDSWIDDPIFFKQNALAVFPMSPEGAIVQAGTERVVFRTDGTMIVRGAPLNTVTLAADGTVSEHGEALGFVMYTPAGTALVSLDGRALTVQVDGNTAQFVSSDAVLEKAPVNQAPRNDMDMPVARPVF